MGFKIFKLCLWQLWIGKWVAVRLSWFWLLVVTAFVLLIFAPLIVSVIDGSAVGSDASKTAKSAAPQAGSNYGPTLFLLVPMVMLVTVFAASTVAIGWHRYVLREEQPATFLVWRQGWPVFRYFWGWVKITLLLFPVVFLALAVVMFTMSIIGPIASPVFVFLVLGLIALALGTLVFWCVLRLGLILPALAVGKPMRLRDSFQLTGPASSELLVTAVLLALLFSVPDMVFGLLDTVLLPAYAPIWIPSRFIVTCCFQWVTFFVGFGILTVLYGHLEEGRAI